jgi:hypothetical protein
VVVVVEETLEDVLNRLGGKIASAREAGQGAKTARSSSCPGFLHRTYRDLALKERHSMEHIFALSKTPDRTIRRYKHNDVMITVGPSMLGRVTIWDKFRDA